jgi:hypothetical protein
MVLTPESYSLLSLCTGRVRAFWHESLLNDSTCRNEYLGAIDESQHLWNLESSSRPLLGHLLVRTEITTHLAPEICDAVRAFLWTELVDRLLETERCRLGNLGDFELKSDWRGVGVGFRPSMFLSDPDSPDLEESSDQDLNAVLGLCVRVVAACEAPRAYENLHHLHHEVFRAASSNLIPQVWDYAASRRLTGNTFVLTAFGASYAAYLCFVVSINRVILDSGNCEISFIGKFERVGSSIRFIADPEFISLLSANQLVAGVG